MNTTKPMLSQTDLTVTHVLAKLLERLEHSAEPVSPEQYRSVVTRLVETLGQITPDKQLGALLDAHPASAEVYENLNYEYAGLCRSPLDPALAAEQQARLAIARAMQLAPGKSANGKTGVTWAP